MGAVRFNLPGENIELTGPSVVASMSFPFFGYNEASINLDGVVGFGPVNLPFPTYYREPWHPWYARGVLLLPYWAENYSLFSPWGYGATDGWHNGVSPWEGWLYHVDPLGLCKVSYGNVMVGDSIAFHITWKEMTCWKPEVWSEYEAPLWVERNTFQVIVYKNNRFEFNYDKIQSRDRVNGYETLVGFNLVTPWLNLPDDRELRYDFPGWATLGVTDPETGLTPILPSAMSDGEQFALTSSSTSNSGVPGRYIFHYPKTVIPPLRQRQRDDGLTTDTPQQRGHGSSLQTSQRRGGRVYY